MKYTLLATLLGSSMMLHASTINVPTTTVNGTDVFSGPTFAVSGNYTASDSFSLTAVGAVDLASGAFTANAAGVIIQPDPTNTQAHPGQVTMSGPFPYASVLIGGGALPFVAFFPADASAGLGSPTPPSTVSATRTVGDLWGGAATLSNGQQLEFRINDINTGDNSGAFRILTTEGDAVPDGGATLGLLGIGAGALAFARSRK